MSNLLSLIKVDLLETLDVRKFKENKSKSISFFAFLILMIILGLFIFSIYSLMFSTLFLQGGVDLLYALLFMGSIGSLITFTTTIFKVKSIFIGKDYDILRSMPIKKFDIIASKIINLYIIVLLYNAVILIPSIVINFILTMDFSFVIIGLILIIFGPAFMMMVACIFSLFITLVADRFKFGNIINFILYTLLFVAIFFFSFKMNSSASADPADVANYYKDMATSLCFVNPTLHLIRLCRSSYLYLLAFVGINIIVFIAVTAFIALLFDNIHAAINNYKSNNVYLKKHLETKGQFKTLLFNEYKRFFTSKYYFLNCIASGIVAVVLTIFLVITINDEKLIAYKQYITNYAFWGSLIVVFSIGIATPASSSISIEGSNFWMIKVFPINYKRLVQAKLLVSVSVLGVFSLISSLIIIVATWPNVYNIILLIFIPLLYVIVSSMIGLLINIFFYKLKWKNEQECVKNSMAVVLSMLIDWAITIVLGAALVGLFFINPYLAGISGLVFIIILGIVFYCVLFRNLDTRFNNIEEF